MGSPAPSPRRLLNISDIVHKVARVYKRPSDCVKPVDQNGNAEDYNPVADGLASEASSGVATLSREIGDVEVNSQRSPPSPASDPSLLGLKVQIMETLISNTFATVSSLKNAYMQLQAAHTPYDPEKLQVADGAVIAELRKLSELKHSYRERYIAITSGQESPAEPEEKKKEAILKSYEGIIANFHMEIRKKNADVENLKDMLAQTTLKKEKLERRVKRLEQRNAKDSSVNISNDAYLDPHLFESAVQGAAEAARNFTRILISLMKASQWDLDAASNSIEPALNYARRSHRKYAFESYVNHRMLSGFENENFYVSGELSSILDPEQHRQECFQEFEDMEAVDPFEIVSRNPDCIFGKFCLKKYLQVVHPKMESSFFGNLELKDKVTNGSHPQSSFYQSFLKVAKAVWLLHRLAFSSDPTASIFQVKRGTEFSPSYMESIVQSLDMENNHPSGQPKVAFTVMPGFRLGKTVIKSQVYIMA